jgi:hypothetical protein
MLINSIGLEFDTPVPHAYTYTNLEKAHLVWLWKLLYGTFWLDEKSAWLMLDELILDALILPWP